MSEEMKEIKNDFLDDLDSAIDLCMLRLRYVRGYNRDEAAQIVEAWFRKYYSE